MMELRDREWRPFMLEDLFEIRSGKRLESRNFKPGPRPFIGAVEEGNGVTGFVSNENESLDKNVLGVNYNGNVAVSFYHPYECLFTDDVKRFHLKAVPDNEFLLLFFKNLILRQRGKYRYGYKFNAARMRKQKILAPVTGAGEPDYDFMRSYVRRKKDRLLSIGMAHFKAELAKLEYVEIMDIRAKKWGAFFIGGEKGIFTLRASMSGIDKNRIRFSDSPNIPYITRGGLNNGIDGFISGVQDEKHSIDAGNVIVVGLDTQTAFYQPYQFFTGQNVQIISNDFLNKFNALFIVALLRRQLKKFSWGSNGATLSRLARTKVLLPAADEGTPDYGYMEQYIKNMIILKCEAYLNHEQQITASGGIQHEQ